MTIAVGKKQTFNTCDVSFEMRRLSRYRYLLQDIQNDGVEERVPIMRGGARRSPFCKS